MSEFIYTEDRRLKPETFLPLPEEVEVACFNCGTKHPTAYWISEKHPTTSLIVCRSCAIRVLPKLIADAIAGAAKRSRPIHRDLFDNLKVVELNYWLGAAAATERINDHLRQENGKLLAELYGPLVDTEDVNA